MHIYFSRSINAYLFCSGANLNCDGFRIKIDSFTVNSSVRRNYYSKLIFEIKTLCCFIGKIAFGFINFVFQTNNIIHLM